MQEWKEQLNKTRDSILFNLKWRPAGTQPDLPHNLHLACQAGLSVASFFVYARVAQLLFGKLLRVSSASRIAPPLGLLAVAGCSVASLCTARSLALRPAPSAASSLADLLFPPPPSLSSRIGTLLSSLSFRPPPLALTRRQRISAVDPAPLSWPGLLTASLAGAALFRLLGWRLCSLFPSDLRAVGSFSRDSRRLLPSKRVSAHSLPATRGQEYASEFERGSIAAIGRLDGCHQCGARSTPGDRWVADHMPTNKAVRSDSRWYHYLWGVNGNMPQRYYPHCPECSQLQSAAVKQHFPALRYNLTRWRSSDLTGLCLFSSSLIFSGF